MPDNKTPLTQNDLLLTQHIYQQFLRIIDGYSFTRREIDIMTLFLHGRSPKKIASLFGISPKTIEYHTQNIFQKINGHSREDILDFIEKSKAVPVLRTYYHYLQTQFTFEHSLKTIATLVKQSLLTEAVRPMNCCILRSSKDKEIQHLVTYLKLAGISVIVKNLTEITKIPTATQLTVIFQPLSALNPVPFEALISTSSILVTHRRVSDESPASPAAESLPSLEILFLEDYYKTVFRIVKQAIRSLSLNIDSIETTFTAQQRSLELLTQPLPISFVNESEHPSQGVGISFKRIIKKALIACSRYLYML